MYLVVKMYAKRRSFICSNALQPITRLYEFEGLPKMHPENPKKILI